VKVRTTVPDCTAREHLRRTFVKGFLGTWASFSSDLNLVVQIAMGISLIAGGFLARAKRYVAHGACQATILVLNLVMIALVMEPPFDQHVMPRLATHFGKRYYTVAGAHGVLGVVTEFLGLYILLVAGTNVVPQSWRFTRWKLWMRIELALWWIVIFTGTLTYYVWYAAPHSR
jgi:uncharacterized membrane protein YozB (DUF420 family)